MIWSGNYYEHYLLETGNVTLFDLLSKEEKYSVIQYAAQHLSTLDFSNENERATMNLIMDSVRHFLRVMSGITSKELDHERLDDAIDRIPALLLECRSLAPKAKANSLQWLGCCLEAFVIDDSILSIWERLSDEFHSEHFMDFLAAATRQSQASTVNHLLKSKKVQWRDIHHSYVFNSIAESNSEAMYCLYARKYGDLHKHLDSLVSIAAVAGNDRLIKFLFERYEPYLAEYFPTVFQLAASFGHSNIIEEFGNNVDYDILRNSMIRAEGFRNLQAVELLARQASFKTCSLASYQRALTNAISNESPACLKHFLECLSDESMPWLHSLRLEPLNDLVKGAFENGNVELINLLLGNGRDGELLFSNLEIDNRALQCALKKKNIALIEIFLTRSTPGEFYDARFAKIDFADELLSCFGLVLGNRLNVLEYLLGLDRKTVDVSTIFLQSCTHGNLAFVDRLLALNSTASSAVYGKLANFETINRGLYLAILYNHNGIAMRLLEWIETNKSLFQSSSISKLQIDALHMAASFHATETLNFLCKDRSKEGQLCSLEWTKEDWEQAALGGYDILLRKYIHEIRSS